VKVISKKMQTRNSAITAKMISGIIATISMVVIGALFLSSFWFWTCLEIIAGLLVAAGCWGEWYLFKNPADDGDESAKRLHHGREVRCIIAVAIGVTVEFAALAHSIPEAVRLEKDVAEIGTTNAQLVADNLVLRSNVAVLEAAVQWRTITQQQEATLIRLLSPLTQNDVTSRSRMLVNSGLMDDEAILYRNRLVDVLKKCGFNPIVPDGLSALTDSNGNPIPLVGLIFKVKHPVRFRSGLIFAAFQEAHIPVEVQSQTDMGEYDLWIVVGHKPEK
jgi:hypothetical protein